MSATLRTTLRPCIENRLFVHTLISKYTRLLPSLKQLFENYSNLPTVRCWKADFLSVSFLCAFRSTNTPPYVYDCVESIRNNQSYKIYTCRSNLRATIFTRVSLLRAKLQHNLRGGLYARFLVHAARKYILLEVFKVTSAYNSYSAMLERVGAVWDKDKSTLRCDSHRMCTYFSLSYWQPLFSRFLFKFSFKTSPRGTISPRKLRNGYTLKLRIVFFPATHTFTLIPVLTGSRKYFRRRNRCWNTFMSTCTSRNIPCHTQVTTQIPNNARSVTRSHKKISIGYLFGRKERLSSARFVP